MRMQHEPVYGPEGHSLRWKIERAAEYVAYLEQDFPAKQRLHRAIDCNDIQQAWSGFKSWRFDAALETGMISSGTHHRHYYPKSSLRNASTLVWWKHHLQYVFRPVLHEANASQRESGLRGHAPRFPQACQWTGTVSGKDELLPLGRRHANAQPPPSFHMPDNNELLSLVSSHISNMNIASSPGFDTITPTFIKCATKRVPRHNGRGQENVNVMAPHIIAALFNMLMTQARVHRSWKEAKLTPIFKKGSLTNPGNYRMIAVIGMLYRLYANVLRFIIQEWCVAQQDPRFPVWFLPRSTLQPLFILRHFNPKYYKQAHHDCMLLASTSSRHTIPYPETLTVTVGTIMPLSHASPSILHPPRLVLHRWVHTAGWGLASKCAARVWCEAMLSPLPPAFFHLLLWCWQSGWRGTGRTYWYSKFCCPITAVCWRPLSAVQCPWPAADHAQQAQSICSHEIFDGEHTNLRWCVSTPGLITALLLSIMTARNYPTPAHSITWACCVTKISFWPLRLMQRWDP